LAKKTIYVFDFDGVLCDSINECMITTYNAYNKTEIFNLDEIPEGFRDFFYQHRSYVKPAKEYFLLCEAFYNKIDLSYNKFNKMKKRLSKKMQLFEDHFFNQRKLMQKNQRVWLSYHKMYRHVSTFISELSSKFYIITNKDLYSVKILSNYFRFDDRIKNILSKEISNDKKILFKYFFDMILYNKDETRIIFVDDNEDNLSRVKNYPIELYFAKWGYAKKQINNSFNEINSLQDIQ
tara:strand:+ start:576 stop:1283 length:708 start_codon:yes stop_codon:yes gene_type:complete